MYNKLFSIITLICLISVGFLTGCTSSEQKELALDLDSEINLSVKNTKEHHEAMISMIEVIANESTTIDGVNELYDYIDFNSENILEDYNVLVKFNINHPDDDLESFEGLEEYIDVSTQYVGALSEASLLFEKYVTSEHMNAISGVSDDTNIDTFREMLTIFTEDMPKLERNVKVAREEFLNNAGFSENEIEEIVANN